MMKKYCIVWFVAIIMILISFHSVAMSLPDIKSNNFQASNYMIYKIEDDDPEGQDGPDDFFDYYYLFGGLIILIGMPNAFVKFIQNMGKPCNFITWLIGEFVSTSYVVIAFLEAFDYKDVDGDGF